MLLNFGVGQSLQREKETFYKCFCAIYSAIHNVTHNSRHTIRATQYEAYNTRHASKTENRLWLYGSHFKRLSEKKPTIFLKKESLYRSIRRFSWRPRSAKENPREFSLWVVFKFCLKLFSSPFCLFLSNLRNQRRFSLPEKFRSLFQNLQLIEMQNEKKTERREN